LFKSARLLEKVIFLALLQQISSSNDEVGTFEKPAVHLWFLSSTYWSQNKVVLITWVGQNWRSDIQQENKCWNWVVCMLKIVKFRVFFW